MDKEDAVHTHSGLFLSVKKNEMVPVTAAWMNVEIIILSEVSQTEKDRYIHDIACMWNLKKMIQMNLYIKHRPTDTEKKFMVTKGESGGGNELGV